VGLPFRGGGRQQPMDLGPDDDPQVSK